MSGAQLTSGSLFVRHFFFGILLIGVSIMGIKFVGIFHTSQYTPVITAGFIALVNFMTLGSYTWTVINDRKLLAEDDSPDHAYYLGFCLTLASLALIFFSDALQNITTAHSGQAVNLTEAAQVKGDLLRGALTQFAAGLMATLLGLSARIYIASKQNTAKQEPTELINQLRMEIFDFSSTLAESRRKHDKMIASTLTSIESTLSSMDAGATQLASTFEASAKVLSESLSAQNLTESSKAFSDAINELGQQTKTQTTFFADTLKELSSSTSALSNDVAQTTAKLNEINSSVALFSSQLVKVSTEDMPKIAASTSGLVTSIDQSGSNIVAASDVAAQKINALGDSVDGVKRAANALNDGFGKVEVNKLKDDINQLSKTILKLTGEVDALAIKMKEQAQKKSGLLSRWF